jgi:hypothetical protein
LLREHLSCPGKNRYHGAWDDLCDIAVEIFESRLETSGVRSSLRYLFYRLVSMGYLKNTTSESTMLSQNSARRRREGKFPKLVDHNREIHRPFSLDSVEEALTDAARWPVDRDAGQPYALFVAVEKSTVYESVKVWLEQYGIPVASLRGYSSQTLIDDVSEDAETEALQDVAEVAESVLSAIGDRPTILFTIGDFDPSGENLMEVFVKYTDCWADVIKVGVTYEQAMTLPAVPPNAKSTDTRLEKFTAKYWPEEYERICHDMRDRDQKERLAKFAEIACQVEVEALEANATEDDPEPLRTLLMAAIAPYWNEGAAAEQIEKEEGVHRILTMLAEVDQDDLVEWLEEQSE